MAVSAPVPPSRVSDSGAVAIPLSGSVRSAGSAPASGAALPGAVPLAAHLRGRCRRLSGMRSALTAAACRAPAADQLALHRRIERVDALLESVGAAYFEAVAEAGG